MKYLIAGLGNIGPEYELTRHNIGFLVLDQLADKMQVDFKFERLAYRAEGRYKGKTLVLIKPTTYMNLSGRAVNYWLKDEKIPLENLLVIADDLALDFGKLRLRPKGTHGGHNGFRDIEATLNTPEYARLRFGIGSNFAKGRQVDYVLQNFTKDEFAGLPLHMDRACEATFAFCASGLHIAMNQFNT